MKTILLIAIALSGCAPKAIVIEPIAPAVTHAAATAKAASVSAKRVSESTVTTAASATSLGFEVAKALAEADRQRTDPRIPEDVAALNWQTLTKLAAKSMEVERQAKSTVAESIAHEDDANASAKESAELVPTVEKHDKAVIELKAHDAAATVDAGEWRTIKAIVGTLIVLAVLAVIAGFVLSGAKKGLL